MSLWRHSTARAIQEHHLTRFLIRPVKILLCVKCCPLHHTLFLYRNIAETERRNGFFLSLLLNICSLKSLLCGAMHSGNSEKAASLRKRTLSRGMSEDESLRHIIREVMLKRITFAMNMFSWRMIWQKSWSLFRGVIIKYKNNDSGNNVM